MTRTSRLLIGAASLVIVIAGLRSASGIVGPAMLAVALTIVFHPLRATLERWMPRWAASVVVVVASYVLLLALALSLVVSLGRLATLIPRYAGDLDRMTERALDRLSNLGVAESHVRAASDSLDVGRLLDATGAVVSSLSSVVTNLFFVITLLLFLAFDSAQASRLADQARAHRPELVDALVTFAQGTRNYLWVSAVFGLIVAVIDTGLLWALGVPGAFVWGVLSFVTNFIPNIGFVLGVVPPALIGLLEGGVGLMLWVIVLYSVVNVVVQSIIQPRYVGSAVGLSTSLTFVSLVFWAWVLGPLGALLAVPMSLLVRALLVDADPDGAWRLPLISGRPEDEPPAAAS
ncbi:AI-2E family transporter [Nocardioides pantholopis]|uniref:AI-2E family transporter n=1 Tax=Nocardioides pantholopis TaxID=2483798 RepID=UPI000F077D33|nr:AI-2E family transporter [Nocardioides pantholopis]